MTILVTGGGGFVGGRLIRRLASESDLWGSGSGFQNNAKITAFDQVPIELPVLPTDIDKVVGDISDEKFVQDLIDDQVHTIYHLSGVVSAGAEENFDLGYRVNLGGLQNILAACRKAGNKPRLVFASSIAVYGGVADIKDDTPLTPLTSYGTQKAICELLINDATRKGFVDGRSIRLSAVVARPGVPNKAASGFTSTIIREPLMGRRAVCPVSPETRMPLVSPGRVCDALLTLSQIDGADLGANRTVLMGALAPTAGETVAALGRVAGATVAARVDWQIDPEIERFVSGWPQTIVAKKASDLGLSHDRSVEEVIQAFIDEELGGHFVA